MKTKLRRPVSLSITELESELVDLLKTKNINPVMIFRRGLNEYKADIIVKDLS